MSKRAYKMLRRRLKMDVCRKPVDAFAWPGGYPLYYLTQDCAVLCPDCVNREIHLIHSARPVRDKRGRLERSADPQWNVVGFDVNWEDADCQCENCNGRIESAYGADEDDTDCVDDSPDDDSPDSLDDADPDSPDDYLTYDYVHWYQNGRLVLETPDMPYAAVKAHMDQEQFWPNAWFISDHGNAHLIDLDSPE